MSDLHAVTPHVWNSTNAPERKVVPQASYAGVENVRSAGRVPTSSALPSTDQKTLQ